MVLRKENESAVVQVQLHPSMSSVKMEPVVGSSAGQTKTQQSEYFGGLWVVSLVLVFSVLDARLLLGWRQINPSNLAWLSGDSAQYQTGWEFLRRQAWGFPPGWLAHLDYPYGISSAYLDVVPIVAVPLHLFAGVLPSDFQYLGAYAAVCLILQAYFGMKLLSCFTSDKILIIIGALFFLDAPVLLFRLFAGHYSLCSQWLIVAAIYYYFRPVQRTNLIVYLGPFAVLAAVAGGITPYITVMVLSLGLAALLRVRLENGTVGFSSNQRCDLPLLRRFLQTNYTLWAAIFAGSVAVSFAFFGFVVFGSSPALADRGYGVFSMNLLSPVASLGLSSLPNPIRVFANQNEGYNYLGTGILLLGVSSIVRNRMSFSKIWAPSLRPLVVASIVLTLLALSIRITAGQKVLLVLPVWPTIFHLLAIFRSSGRFFWPVWYLLIIAAIVGGALSMPGRTSRRAVLAAALALQFLDTMPLMSAVAGRSGITVTNPLRAKEWIAVAQSYKHLVILPARQCDATLTPGGPEGWPFFARFAARNELTLNSVYAARISRESETLNCTLLPRKVAAGQVESDTAYILDDRIARIATAHAHTFRCSRLDGFNLCTVNRSVSPLLRPLHSGG